MSLKSVGLVCLAAISLEISRSIFRWAANQFLGRSNKRRVSTRQETTMAAAPFPQCVRDVLFFPDFGILCRDFKESPSGCRDSMCPYSHEDNLFEKFLNYVRNARVSIDVCVFLLTSFELTQALFSCHKRGGKVRVITESEESYSSCSQSRRLRKFGIEVNVPPQTDSKMHHKFIVIDGKILLSGSCNWTNCAIRRNYENIMITDEENIVKAFQTEFQKLWVLFGQNAKSPKLTT